MCDNVGHSDYRTLTWSVLRHQQQKHHCDTYLGYSGLPCSVGEEEYEEDDAQPDPVTLNSCTCTDRRHILKNIPFSDPWTHLTRSAPGTWTSSFGFSWPLISQLLLLIPFLVFLFNSYPFDDSHIFLTLITVLPEWAFVQAHLPIFQSLLAGPLVLEHSAK